MRWTRLQVSTRLYGVITIVLCIVLVALGQSYWQNRQSEAATREVLRIEQDRTQQVAQWHVLASVTTAQIQALNRSRDPAIASFFGPGIGARVDQIIKSEHVVRQWARTPQEQAWFANLDILGKQILSAIADISKARTADDEVTATQIFEQRFIPATNAYDKALDQFSEIRKERFASSMEALHAQNRRSWRIGAVLILLFAAMAVASVMILMRYVTSALNRAIAQAQAVAAGNLSSTQDRENTDEFGALMQAMRGMTYSLREVVAQVRTTSQAIAATSAEIAQGNAELSARTEEQIVSLEQTTATMNALSVTVQQNVEHAQQANRLVQNASVVASSGGEVVGAVVTTMRGIENSSRRISEIISTIDGIAFQTNILALNAAVEAARAGEQGRGFAVVAAEVRTLAQRSAVAAREIKELISDSVGRVQSGTQLVDRAGQTMREIVSSVDYVRDIVGQISNASVAQSAGIAELGTAVVQLERATQKNCALVEHSASASESLRRQAVGLQASVTSFTLDDAAVTSAAPQQPRLPAAFALVG